MWFIVCVMYVSGTTKALVFFTFVMSYFDSRPTLCELSVALALARDLLGYEQCPGELLFAYCEA